MFHKKTDSQDSTFNLRMNPFDIRNSDGSDLVLRRKVHSLGPPADYNKRSSTTDLLVNSLVQQQRHSYGGNNDDNDDGDLPHHLRIRKRREGQQHEQLTREDYLKKTRDQLESLTVSTEAAPEIPPRASQHGLQKNASLSQESPIDLTSPVEELQVRPTSSKSAGVNDSNPPLVNKALSNLKTTGHGHSDSVASVTSQTSEFIPLDVDIADDDLAMDFLSSFEELKSSNSSLGRKNTINSNQKARIGPSQTPALFSNQFTKTSTKLHNKVTDPISELSIPTPLLNAISFGEREMENNGQYKPPQLMERTFKSNTSLATTAGMRNKAPSLASSKNSAVSSPSTVSSGSNRTDTLSSDLTGRISPSTQKTDNDDESIYEDAYEDSPEPHSPVIAHSPQLDELDPVDPADRGRLFLKIQTLQDLRLPMDYGRRPRFNLTLDNGIQSVQTYPMKFPTGQQASMIPIDQEFELMVGDGLDLVLTLSGTMDELPKPKEVPERQEQEQDEVKEPETPKKKRFSLFTSPGKKKKTDGSKSPKKSHKKTASEILTGNQIAAAAASEAASKVVPTMDVWKDIVGRKGEFARIYISEQDFEKDIYGREKSFLLSCFNEWIYTKVPIKDAVTGQLTGGFKSVREPPRRIGGLKVTMLYVPRFCRSEPIPKSMKECTEELENALKMAATKVQGALSQHGGDCVFWRRRWFMLDGDSMVGHTEETRKVRNIINVGNIREVIEMDKAPEDEDPCINEERAFRLIFKNNESMSFYADSIEDKDRWVQAIRVAMTRTGGRLRSWTDLVIRQREKESEEESAFAKRYDHHLKETRGKQYNHHGGMFIETL